MTILGAISLAAWLGLLLLPGRTSSASRSSDGRPQDRQVTPPSATAPMTGG